MRDTRLLPHRGRRAGAADSYKTLRTVPAGQLISSSLARFTRDLIADGNLSLHLATAGGPVQVQGGDFGPQTIQSLPISAADQAYLRQEVSQLDAVLDLDFSWAASPAKADVVIYVDREINLGDGGETLGIALSNSTPSRDYWEVIINGPALVKDQSHFRYALIHELGHALGLEHPFDRYDGDWFASATPSASAFPEETVMAYRDPVNGRWPMAYSDNDLDALVQLWGKEAVRGSAAADRLTGTRWGEELLGLAGNDRLSGAAGNDRLSGGPGNDWLHGGAGNDELTGGPGADRFVLSEGLDRIRDFNPKEGDRLECSKALDLRWTAGFSGVLLNSSLGRVELTGLAASAFDPASHIVWV